MLQIFLQKPFFDMRRAVKRSAHRLLPILLAALIVFANAMVLTHRVAHSTPYAVDAGGAQGVSTPSTQLLAPTKTNEAGAQHAADTDFLSILFGHDAGEACQGYDASTGHDANSAPLDTAATFAICACDARPAIFNPHIFAADLFSLSLARAPPQV